MYGYNGKIISVDLSTQTITTISLNEDHARHFIGGSGYASRILYDLLDFDSDPLDPDNILLFMTGPLTGTLAPCTGRHVVCARSPLTGLWGESNSGGFFGAELKFAGYDGILITGKSIGPSMLTIHNDEVSIRSATHLWGLDTNETQSRILQEWPLARIACIGPAGENLVRFSSVVNEERVAARCGMGAVMGSKNLKAVVVKGSTRPSLFAPDDFRNLALELSKKLRAKHRILGYEGTAMYVNRGMSANDMPVKYFQEPEFDVTGLDADAMSSILTGRKACYACPIGCGRVVSIPGIDVSEIAGPEFQTIAAFGSNMQNPEIRQVAHANWLCNLYGLDTISCGSTIALVMDLCEKGLLDWNIRWGDMESVFQMIQDIALRTNRGDELAEGALRFARKYGLEDHVLHVKGLEIPNHDPRAYAGLAAVYAVSARGASHTESDMHTIDIGIDVPSLGIHSSDRVTSEGKGRTAAKNQDFRAFHDSMILCHFPEVSPSDMVTLLNLATGSQYVERDILECGSRIVAMKRRFNLRCGLTPQDDVLPTQLLQPLIGSVTEEWVPDLHAQLDEYYSYRKWDRETGEPSV
ncbi:MAG: aldehyde ferredoxin oxidoreductase family protein [Candidatus Thorarchaeota archaeon]